MFFFYPPPKVTTDTDTFLKLDVVGLVNNRPFSD